ncbi:hypothetical protein [Xanthomonas phage BUDD]|nr:hypothetical protein [Xanthomonas phage BUDD]
MKSFFDEQGFYNEDARNFTKDAQAVLRPLMQKYAALGFSSRELVYLITDEAAMEEIYIRQTKRIRK